MQLIARTSFEPLRDFFRAERTSGVVLVGATLVALVWSNAAPALYDSVWTTTLPLRVGPWTLNFDARHWISDAAMALFFFVVGLEIRRELVDGELRAPRQAALPILAAFGGMLMPALLYFALNPVGEAARGWAIPMATDIAFAVGVISLLGSRVPVGLRLFLLSVAIVDDIGAITVIALFYSDEIIFGWLAAVLATLGAFWTTWRLGAGVLRSGLLVALGLATWLFVHESGVHATIAGVALAMLVPAEARPDPSAAERLEHALHPWTGLIIVPLFALASAGVQLSPAALGAALGSPVAIGVFVGLVVGKGLGLSGAAFIAVTLGLATLPKGVRRMHVIGASMLGGIGFTVSLFIAQLAFSESPTIAAAKIAIFAGSIVAGAAGYAVLRVASARGS